MKQFKVAHIVPVTHLNATENNQYHMCLAHLVDCIEYADFYRRMSDEGKYVLMDNGAAEGNQLQLEKLLEMYEVIRPTEIVLPDTLYEAGSTIQKSRNFMTLLNEHGLKDTYKVMAVPQGSTLEEWEACARIFVKDTRINSIGVSKFLNIATADRYVRIKACDILARLLREYNRSDMEVHLLGCDEGPLIVKVIHKAHPCVRGCDSAFAYLQAQSKKELTLEDDERPKGTIDFIKGGYYKNLQHYVANFEELAGVKDNGNDTTWQCR